MIYTIQEIAEYRAGWLETHPDEVLDDYTIICCLDDDERSRSVETLIADDKTTIAGLINSDSFLDSILRNGHEGYENMTTIDLRDEMKTRGLEL